MGRSETTSRQPPAQIKPARTPSRAIPRPPKDSDTLHAYAIVWQDGKLRTDVTADLLQSAIADPHALIWLDFPGDPTRFTGLLARTFNLARITVETVVEPQERAKLSEGDGYFYLVMHSLLFNEHDQSAITPKIDIIFGSNYLISFHREPAPWLTDLRKAGSRRQNEEHLMSRGVAVLLYYLLDTLVDSYFPILDTLDDQIDELEDETINNAGDAVQARIFRTKRSLAFMRRVISPQVEVANALITRTGDLIPREIEPYFADVHDHLVRAFEVLDSYRDLMSGLLDVYLSTVSNRLNVVMKQLALIATIFMPITFITGVFGQNFGHIPQVEHDNGYVFWYVLGFMALVTLVQIWYFKRRGWL